ncbi:MAG TPA: outer membrane beta-barrel protein [Xanthobacteraceae bacterium]|nr:outer membrane beta-barrel protein [Xanthobacteraceae bacterium]
MRRVVLPALLSFAAIAASGAARAADLPAPYIAPPLEVSAAGWYLRGDIGFSNQKLGSLTSVEDSTTDFTWLANEFDAAPIFGAGVGYKFNDWLRVDVTGEYRGKSSFNGMDSYVYWDGDTPVTRTNRYTADKSEWLFLANAYLDLGTWYSITPFVGAGIGASRNTISGYTDTDSTPGYESFGYANSDSKWNFAWALYAGLAYQVTPNFTIEFAYRYVDLGDGITGDVRAADGTSSYYNPVSFNDITSQDFRLGLRWLLGDATVVEAYPVVRKD